MNSKRKRFAVCFCLPVGRSIDLPDGERGDNLWLVSWGDLIPSLFVLFIAGDCLYSSPAAYQARGRTKGIIAGVPLSLFLIFSVVFMGDLFFIGHFIIDKLLG